MSPHSLAHEVAVRRVALSQPPFNAVFIDMYTQRKLNWQPGPAWGYAFGVVLLLIAGGLLYLVIDGYVNGEIIRLSRVNPGVITLEDNPSEFWLSEIFFAYFVVFLTVLGILSLRRAFKRSRK